MPFINSRVSIPMKEEKKEAVKRKLGQAISIIPGKSERWLMIEFTDNCDLYFQGRNEEPIAFIEIKVFGRIEGQALDKMTETVCDIYEEEMQIKKDHIYIKYEEVDKWGWNGSNF